MADMHGSYAYLICRAALHGRCLQQMCSTDILGKDTQHGDVHIKSARQICTADAHGRLAQQMHTLQTYMADFYQFSEDGVIRSAVVLLD